MHRRVGVLCLASALPQEKEYIVKEAQTLFRANRGLPASEAEGKVGRARAGTQPAVFLQDQLAGLTLPPRLDPKHNIVQGLPARWQ